MDNISDIISNLSEQDIENLKEAAQSILGGSGDGDDQQQNNNNANQDHKQNSNPFSDLSSIDPKMLSKMSVILSNMNKSNPRSDLISALIPLISSEKRQKANEAMKLLQLIEILPLLKDMT